jgi:hypothetical protein
LSHGGLLSPELMSAQALFAHTGLGITPASAERACAPVRQMSALGPRALRLSVHGLATHSVGAARSRCFSVKTFRFVPLNARLQGLENGIVEVDGSIPSGSTN